jgi:exonuclease SbcC
MANLAAAAGSDNAKQLTLASYVLARRFEDVVAAANGRLTAMSGGRFELARSEEKEAVRARRTGLAMKVVDHEIGRERDPRTLSGGETFYVSLCLALGLADVVTAEAGGTELGTLFVDEGFGTLDAETLEVVLAELGRLRDGGRVVGVVSHVEALKQAIAERVAVRRLPGGGSTLTVRA